MYRKNGLRTYCFSPPVMAITAVVELSLMVFTLWKYRKTKLGRLSAAMLYFLAMFQVAEYNICGGMIVSAQTWSRFGFIVIAILPPLGIHLARVIAKAERSWQWLQWLAYGTMAMWIALFGFTERMFADHACGGNYIIFHVRPTYGAFYMFYYYFWLFAGIFLSAHLMKKANKSQKESLFLLIVGYLVFMVPTALLNSLNPQTFEGLPSILCGFAVFFALLLVFGILPLSHKRSTKKRT